MPRPDNRAPGELRPVRITPDYLMTAEGSVLVEIGYTRVVCAATVESALPSWLRNSGRGWVTAEYAMLPRATVERTAREVNKGKPSGRTHEIQRLIGRSLRAVVDMQKLGERSIIVDCDVLQADGGTRTAAITGGYVALALAVAKLQQYKTLPAGVLTGAVAATSVGLLNGEPVLDLCYEEDSRAAVDMNVVMTGNGQFIELQATAEKAAFNDDQLAAMLALARQGIAQLLAAQRAAMGSLEPR